MNRPADIEHALLSTGITDVLEMAKELLTLREAIRLRDNQVANLQDALRNRRFNQTMHKEMRDEWAMAIFQARALLKTVLAVDEFQFCYRQADIALAARINTPITPVPDELG